jgi:hypothetical protein
MNGLFLLLPLVAFTGSASGASNCPEGGTTIYFGNGIRTDLNAANGSLKKLRKLTDDALDARDAGRDRSCVQYQLSYDSQFTGKNGEPIVPVNFVLQLADALVQKRLLDYSKAWAAAWVNDLTVGLAPGVADMIGQSVSDLAVSIAAPFQGDLQQHRILYQSDLDNGNNVIVVAHSQGNLYVDEAYRLVSIPPGRTFTVVAVASPETSTVSSGSVWVTLVNDIIRLVVPDSLDSNTVNNIPNDRCRSAIDIPSRVSCHDFDSSYLAGDISTPKIVNATIASVPFYPTGPVKQTSFTLSFGNQSATDGQTLTILLPVGTTTASINITTASGGDLSLDGVPLFSIIAQGSFWFSVGAGTHTVSLVNKGLQVQGTIAVSHLPLLFSVSCTCLPSPVSLNQTTTCSSQLSGGSMPFQYAWTTEGG